MIWTEKLFLFSLFIQTLELWRIRSSFSDAGIWRTADLRAHLPLIQARWLLSAKNFDGLLALRLILIPLALVIPDPTSIFLFLFASQLLIQLRFQGSFNGGSDYLTTQTLGAIWIYRSFLDQPLISQACVLYLGLQVCFSYFISGLGKVPSADWRSGRALSDFLLSSKYRIPQKWKLKARAHSPILKLGTMAVLAFELSFPLCLLNPLGCWFWILPGVLFHWMNYRIFGLNRFFWAWIACYPALLEAARWIQGHVAF